MVCIRFICLSLILSIRSLQSNLPQPCELLLKRRGSGSLLALAPVLMRRFSNSFSPTISTNSVRFPLPPFTLHRILVVTSSPTSVKNLCPSLPDSPFAPPFSFPHFSSLQSIQTNTSANPLSNHFEFIWFTSVHFCSFWCFFIVIFLFIFYFFIHFKMFQKPFCPPCVVNSTFCIISVFVDFCCFWSLSKDLKTPVFGPYIFDQF